ncbi:MAG TPA: 16S rRNA (guanine(527)-N(7))-methyltransferase RsmG [bacterium]|nr:16S rRNA (guanine(527)-N(7))-methyltransferase RsmG [bacterium]
MSKDCITQAFAQIGCTLSPIELDRFDRLLEAFLQKNSQINLSAIRTPEGVIEKHFADSAMLLDFIAPTGDWLDLGSGGGFPGLPLAILCPDVGFTLLDSVGKKTRATEEFIEVLDLPNARAIWGRAEELGKKPDHAKLYNAVVSRATAYLPKLIAWAAPFIGPGGTLYAYKLYDDAEMTEGNAAAKSAGMGFVNAYPYMLGNQERVIYEYKRIR